MYLQNSARGVAASIASLLLMGSSSALFAADAPTAVPSKEMRAQMAALHVQMAACLRSDKPMSECRTQMIQSCQSKMGSQGCRAAMGTGMGMGSGMMGRGQGMHGYMMSSPPSNSGHPK